MRTIITKSKQNSASEVRRQLKESVTVAPTITAKKTSIDIMNFP
jgi:hypothetical protein